MIDISYFTKNTTNDGVWEIYTYTYSFNSLNKQDMSLFRLLNEEGSVNINIVHDGISDTIMSVSSEDIVVDFQTKEFIYNVRYDSMDGKTKIV